MENDPLVSVVVPTYNAQTHLNRLIDSVTLNNYAKIEIIVVDDYSSPPVHLPESAVGTLLLRNSRNCGKAFSVNRGVEVSKGEYLIITDPDVEFDPNLVSTWVKHLSGHPMVGIAGAYIYYASDRSRLTHAGALMRGLTHTLPRRLDNKLDAGFSIDTFCDSRLVLDDAYIVRRNIWKDVGGMDSKIFDTMYEDADLQIRISRKGYDICICAGARAYHHQDVVTGQLVSRKGAAWTTRGYRSTALVRNRLLFLRKHRLTGVVGLSLNAALLVGFYGLLSILGGGEKTSIRTKLGNIVIACIDGLRRPLVV